MSTLNLNTCHCPPKLAAVPPELHSKTELDMLSLLHLSGLFQEPREALAVSLPAITALLSTLTLTSEITAEVMTEIQVPDQDPGQLARTTKRRLLLLPLFPSPKIPRRGGPCGAMGCFTVAQVAQARFLLTTGTLPSSRTRLRPSWAPTSW